MRHVRALLFRLFGTFRSRAREQDMAAELESHLELHIDDDVRAGATPEEARRRAILALGGVEQAKERYRERSRLPVVAHLFQDTRYGARSLRKSPGFAAAAIVTLALGLGANMTMFHFVDAVLLESLPVPAPEELVLVRPWTFSYPAFREFATRNADVLGSTAAHWPVRINLTAHGATDRSDHGVAGPIKRRPVLCSARGRSTFSGAHVRDTAHMRWAAVAFTRHAVAHPGRQVMTARRGGTRCRD